MSTDPDLDLAIALSLSEGGSGSRNRSPFDLRAQSKPSKVKSQSQQEKEDEDFALSLQMQEHEESKRDEALEAKRKVDDEQLARALQAKESGGSGSSTRPGVGGRAEGGGGGGGSGGGLLAGMMAAMGRGGASHGGDSNVCGVCGHAPFDGVVVRARGKTYCVGCMRCRVCRKRLEGQVYHHDSDRDGLYCHPCLQQKYGMRCVVCDSFLVGQYVRHNYFDDEKYCVTHEEIEQRRKCTSCHRVEPQAQTGRPPFVDLPDSRTVCLECLDSAVMTTDEMAALYQGAVNFMETHLSLTLPPGMRDVPVLAVDTHSLNEERLAGSLTHGNVGGQVRGLTLSRCGEMRHYSRGDMTFDWRTGWRVGPSRVFKVDHIRTVTAVLVLYGLPRDLTASILAHEATHVYLKLTKSFPTDLSLPSEEGLCQVVAHRFLKHLRETNEERWATSSAASGRHGVGARERIRTGGFDFQSLVHSSAPRDTVSVQAIRADPSAEIEDKLRGFFVHSIESDQSAVYGDGFRHAKKVVDALGIDFALDELRSSKSLPNCV
jgi:hypothetical protein